MPSPSSPANFAVLRRLSTNAINPLSLRRLKNLCYRHRHFAITAAQRALFDYLHFTRSLPSSHADHISTHSPSSLLHLLSLIPFASPCTRTQISPSIRRFLSFRPPNEFDFFFESIGVSPSRYSTCNSTRQTNFDDSCDVFSGSNSRPRGMFLSDDQSLLSAVSTLVHFGFPWTRLGLIYEHSSGIFETEAEVLIKRLDSLEKKGRLGRVAVIGICLTFPWVLGEDWVADGEVDLLCRDLRALLVDSGLGECVGDSVDDMLRVLRKVRLFYEFGSTKGVMGELMGVNRKVFLEMEEGFIKQKLSFFESLGVEKSKVGAFVLLFSEVMDLDLDGPAIVVPDYLKRVGLEDEKIARICERWPYVLGKNSLGNLPAILRILDLHQWFLGKLIGGGNFHYLSLEFCSSILAGGSNMEEEFKKEMERLKSLKKVEFLDVKLDFLLGIGFGENKYTTRAIFLINGTKEQLQERFDCLLELGIEYSMLCRMINASPKLLNQCKESLWEKVNYLCNDLNYPLEYLDTFPGYLCFDLENRTKKRFRMLNWLKELGLIIKPLSPATVLANSEKKFVVNLYSIHPAAPKHWFEHFSV